MEQHRRSALFGSFVNGHVKVVVIFIIRVDALEASGAFFDVTVDLIGIGSFPEIQFGKGDETVRELFADLYNIII